MKRLLLFTFVGLILGGAFEAHAQMTFTPFITTWTTSNTEVTIPTNSGETYSYDVTWTNMTNAGIGDGSVSGQTGDYTITGLENGSIYQVEILGNFPRIYFNNSGDKDKILTIEEWGNNIWTSMESAFYGCSNLTVPATDAPDLSNVTSMNSMFRGTTSFNQNIGHWDVGNVQDMGALFFDAISFNQDISGWDVSSVTNMAGTSDVNSGIFRGASAFNQDISNWDVSNVLFMTLAFSGASAFNQNIGDWDISSVVDMFGMLNNSGLSKDNYESTLLGWATLDAGETKVPTGITLNATSLEYCNTSEGRSTLESTYNWTFNGDIESCSPFITIWKTDNGGESNDDQITIRTNTFEFTYDYDIYWEDVNDSNVNGTLTAQTGNTTITFLSTGTYRVEITGDFPHLYYLSGGVTDAGKLLTVEQWGDITWQSMNSTFYDCFELRINAVDNPDLSNVTDMSFMFEDAAMMNHDMSDWDVSNVTKMSNTFRGALAFDQNIGSWDVSNVTVMNGMFDGAREFNQPIGGWDVSNVELMSRMFAGAIVFNGDISGWNTSNVTNIFEMFSNAVAFNQDIGGWDVSGADNFMNMFINAENFNQDIGSWDVSNALNMHQMFFGATAFDQDLSSWSVSQVTDMTRMFANAESFDQSLGAWDISAVSSMNSMLFGCGMSGDNYDNTLAGWAALPSLQSNNSPGPDGLSYCSSKADRALIITNYNWTFEGDSEKAPVPDLEFLPILIPQCELTTPTAPTATDCDGNTIDGVPDITFPITGQIETEITWTFDNGNGGVTTQTQLVEINDTEAPVADVTTLDDINGICSVTPQAPLATDNCAGEIVATSNIDFPITEQGTTVVTWTYDDGNGNTSSQTQNVILDDSEAPIPDVEELPGIDGGCTGLVEFVEAPTATDNCGGTIIGVPDVIFPVSDASPITWTYDDGNGNVSTQMQFTFILAPYEGIEDEEICEGETYIFPDGTEGTTTMTHVSNLTTSLGCDSTITTNLTVLSVPEVDLGVETVFFCIGDELAFGINESLVDFQTYRIFSIAGESIDDSLKFVVTQAQAPALDGNTVIIELTGTTGCVAYDTVHLFDNTMKNWGIGITDPTNDPTVVISNSLIPETADGFEWDFGDGATNSTDVNPTHTYTENGNYDITLSVFNECEELSLSVSLTISGACPIEDGSVSESAGMLTANASGFTYQWIDCGSDQAVAGATSQSFTPTESGNYAVEISDGTCTVTSACTQVEVAPLGLTTTKLISIYPNPVAEKLLIKSSTLNFNFATVINTAGQEMIKTDISKKREIDVKDLSSGVYFLQIEGDEIREIHRFIKK